jgi:DNA-binding transcriptional ArsR family regulator
MHGKKLFELAHIVGLTQSAVARHFRINRVQVHYWAQGQRSIPAHYLEPLMELVFQAVKAFLKAGHADTEAPPTLLEASSGNWVSPFRRQIHDLLYECSLENIELRGVGPSASITELATEIGTYATMPTGALRKPENASHIRELSEKLLISSQMLVRLGPLMDLVADDGVPEESTSTEPAA